MKHTRRPNIVCMLCLCVCVCVDCICLCLHLSQQNYCFPLTACVSKVRCIFTCCSACTVWIFPCVCYVREYLLPFQTHNYKYYFNPCIVHFFFVFITANKCTIYVTTVSLYIIYTATCFNSSVSSSGSFTFVLCQAT